MKTKILSKKAGLFFILALTALFINCGSKNDDVGQVDTDGDGIVDFDDDCISIPGPGSNNGCPDNDIDNDGILNENDDCPDVAGTTGTNGCPDNDSDGIANADDECPDEPGTAGLNGCPEPDIDGDGVPDSVDDCPEEAGTVPLNGCPVDDTENITYDQIGNGVNLQPSYYNSGNPPISWDLMDNYPAITTIRIEIEPFMNIETAKTWLQGAQDIGLTVIATYHDNNGGGLGTDIVENLTNGAEWWVENYAELRETGPFIINMANEWGSHNITASAYANAYNEAIETVRGVYSGLIIIDVPGYGQNTKVAADASPMITDQNIILSAHIYEGAYYQPENRAFEASDLNQLEMTGRPCIIGEFGHDATPDLNETEYANWLTIVEHARDDLGWPVLGWAWNGDGGSTMNMVTPSWAEDATTTDREPSAHMDRIIDVLDGP